VNSTGLLTHTAFMPAGIKNNKREREGKPDSQITGLQDL